MAFVVNHYELLQLPINATTEQIKAAYNEKIEYATPAMAEQYKTAYYILTDPVRRQKYDVSLGIHKYRNVPVIYRIGKAIARVILTVLDALFSFYWCFLFVIIVAIAGFGIYKWKNTGALPDIVTFCALHRYEIIMLAGFAAIDLLGHFYVRRANRFLKHYNWEYIVKEEKNNGRKLHR